MPNRIIVAILAFACLLPLNVGAQTERHDVRSGNRDFKKGDFRQSEIDYRKAVVKDSLSVPGQYNLASSLYRQGDYDAAAQAMDVINRNNVAVSGASGADIAKGSGKNEGVRTIASDYYYNAGDVALQKKDYGAAVKAFRESLLANPDDLDAKENYIYAKKMLQDQQGGGGGQNDQNQDQNDQNQDQDQDQNQNSDQNQDNKNNGGQQPQQSQMSPQQAQQMLQAIQAKEKETQDKVNKEKAAAMSSRQKEKNW